jgi:hypothetical protein
MYFIKSKKCDEPAIHNHNPNLSVKEEFSDAPFHSILLSHFATLPYILYLRLGPKIKISSQSSRPTLVGGRPFSLTGS